MVTQALVLLLQVQKSLVEEVARMGYIPRVFVSMCVNEALADSERLVGSDSTAKSALLICNALSNEGVCIRAMASCGPPGCIRSIHSAMRRRRDCIHVAAETLLHMFESGDEDLIGQALGDEPTAPDSSAAASTASSALASAADSTFSSLSLNIILSANELLLSHFDICDLVFSTWRSDTFVVPFATAGGASHDRVGEHARDDRDGRDGHQSHAAEDSEAYGARECGARAVHHLEAVPRPVARPVHHRLRRTAANHSCANPHSCILFILTSTFAI